MNLLAVRFGRVGDTLLVWRALTGVAEHGVSVTMLTDERIAPLFRSDPALVRVVGWPRAAWKRQPKWRAALGMTKALGDLRRLKWDMVVDFQGFSETNWLARSVGASLRIGRPSAWSGWCLNRVVAPLSGVHHDIEDHRQLVREVGGSVREQDRPLVLESEANAWAEGAWRRYGLEGESVLAVNPGASVAYKRWHPETMGEAARLICERHHLKPLIVWGPGEEEAAQRVLAAIRFPGNLAEPTSLPQLGGLLKRARLLLTNDSGPMHLAGALGTPVAAMFFKEHSRPEASSPVGAPSRIWWASKDQERAVQPMVDLAGELLRG